MKSTRKQNSLQSVLVIAFLTTLLIYLSIIPVSANTNSLEQTDISPKYEINSKGLTFGSVDNALSYELEPDLILAQATNGKEGYVYKRDLDEASHYYMTDEEWEAFSAERDATASKLIRESVDRQLGTNSGLSQSDAMSILEDVRYGEEAFVDFEKVATEFKAETKSRSVVANIDADIILNAYLEADEAMTVYIPVYSSDGVTVIGEFPVGQL